MKSRIILIFLFFLVLWSAMIFKAVELQIAPDKRLSQLKQKQFNKIITLQSRRGAIEDRNGKELAVTIPSYSLFADPSLIKKPRQISMQLAKQIKASDKNIYRKIKDKDKRFVWLKRHLNKTEMQKIADLKLRGISFIEEPVRIYPNDDLLSSVLGFVGSENFGLEGLELKYDDELRGIEKKINVERDARGRPLILNGRIFTENPDGGDLQLTIDAEVQYMLQKELRAAVEKHSADAAVGVVMEAATGEILAMASVPTFNLNAGTSYAQNVRRNRAVMDAFEPGSTLKPFVIAAAIQEGLVKPSTKFYCEKGRYLVGGHYITEAEVKEKFEWMTVSEILSKSSNIGTTKVAMKLGANRLRRSLKSFGFGEKLKIDLPGESPGILNPLPWRPLHLANVSFGHGIATTPLQIASAYAAIANGGLLNKPYIVKSVKSSQAESSREIKPETLRRVMTPEVASTLRLMLSAATDDTATGVSARIPGFPVAGKTGTAQKVDPNGRGYLKNQYIASFAGFLPAHAPRFVVYVAVDNPQKQYYGSQVAAPVFSKMASYLVRHFSLPPVLISEKSIIKSDSKKSILKAQQKKALAKLNQESASVQDGRVPDLQGLTLREVLQRLRAYDVDVRVIGQGRVAKTLPEAGNSLPQRRPLKVFLKQ